MSTNTTNYKLIKPDRTDNVLVEDINYNTEIIDQELKRNATSIINLPSTYVLKTDLATETIKGISQLATQSEVDNGLEDTKIVTSKKLKARLDSMLASIGTNFVKLTQLATESVSGIVKISTTAQVSAGTDNSTAVSPAKLFGVFANLKETNGYQKMPNGIIFQWGIAPDNVTNIYFPIAFLTGCASVQITRGGGIIANSTGSSGVGAPVVVALSNIGFTVDSVVQSTDKSLVYWFAIGY
jgi:hypothetical protein